MIKYYLIENLGYDGLILTTYNTFLEAETEVKNILKAQKDWDEKYPTHPSDRGFIVIAGEIVASDHAEEILGD
jgi:hypothetical protein